MATLTTVTFWDETSVNPFPPGVQVTLVNTSAGLIGVNYTTVGGSIAVALNAGSVYAASFVGTQSLGAQPVVFTATTPVTNVVIPNYRSPSLSAAGYAQMQMGVLPKDDFPPSALTSGGVAYGLGYAFGSGMFAIDYETQQTLAADRIQSCTGGMIDSWANDFIGYGIWPRGSQETDPAYMARILLWLQAPMTTLYGIQELVQSFIYSQATASLLQPLALDTQGALDEFGALDGNVLANNIGLLPTIQVVDYQSNSTICNQISGFVQDEGQFVIVFNFANSISANNWFAGVSFAGVNTFAGVNDYTVISAPTTQIASIVNAVKADGTWPLYVSNVVG